MDEVWPWLASIPLPAGPDTPPRSSFPLAASHDGASIVLKADCTSTSGGSTAESVVIGFSLAVDNDGKDVARTLWMSETFSAASLAASRLQLLAQLLDEVIALAPSISSLGRNLGPDASESKLDAVIEATETDGSGSAFFSLALLLRLFWLCALEAPADFGYLFFQALGAEIERTLGNCTRALGVFLLSVGPDVEERFMRSLGYMLAKWCLLREMQAPSAANPPDVLHHPAACLSYASEVHGLWVLKGYAPVLAMPCVAGALAMPITASPHELPEEPALRYGLVHQQLEYAVRVRGKRFISVGVRVDNIRVRVVRLGYRKNDADATEGDDVMDGETHFPSRIRLWVGPRFGSSYATGPSLGRSTGNPEREVEMTRTVKGAFSGATKLASSNGGPRVKAKMRTSARTRNRSWRWEQEAEGSAGVFEGVLCDPVTGTEVSAWCAGANGGAAGEADPRNGMRRRYAGPRRAFSKMRGLVVASDELPEEVTWRVGREAEGRTMRWRVGLRAWVSYLPNEVRSRHFESRCVEWAHEVDLPLVAANGEESWLFLWRFIGFSSGLPSSQNICGNPWFLGAPVL